MRNHLKIWALFPIFVLTGIIISQDTHYPSKVAKVAKQKPGVSLIFLKYGKRPPLRPAESGDGIWLRLRNNMNSPIRFCAFGILKGERMTFYTPEAELVVNYSIEMTQQGASVGNTGESTRPSVPTGYPVISVCNYYELESGHYVDFRIPREHLSKGLGIRVPFRYEWEQDHEKNPQHLLYFDSSELQP